MRLSTGIGAFREHPCALTAIAVFIHDDSSCAQRAGRETIALSLVNTHRSMMALGSICGFRRFQFFAQRQRPQPNPPSSAPRLGAGPQAINPFRMKIAGASVAGAQAASDRLVLHTI